ncbi:MAG TPA: SIR2 family protein [Micromonosporaceae bacterium]|nr:SIR2 family protein [Micromonosporaceae bacterium]
MSREAAYLAGISPDHARRLAQVNAAGLDALRQYLGSGQAVAFLGAGASAPLYPLWTEVISQLIDAAVARGLAEEVAGTCHAVAGEQPDAVVELLRRHLGPAQYAAALGEVFRVRRDPDTGRTWTPTQELVCRCAFKAVVTTNYDPGIVDARMRVRPRASGTGFASWTDELALDRWRTGEVFGDDELPVLFAHGHHNQPEAMVLATTEYRRAYAGKLSRLLASMVDAWHLVWVGFSFADQRISDVLREAAEHSGSRVDPGGAVRHVAVMAWDPDGGRDPQVLRSLAGIQYGADLVLYPVPKGDHSALQRLLADFTVVRVAEAIELLLDADQWSAADSLYRSRTDNGAVWKHLPAARLGQRAAFAFVAAPARRQFCGDLLGLLRLRFYLNAVGLFSMIGGDLVTAQEYLDASNAQSRQTEDWKGLSVGLLNLTGCLAYCGRSKRPCARPRRRSPMRRSPKTTKPPRTWWRRIKGGC